MIDFIVLNAAATNTGTVGGGEQLMIPVSAIRSVFTCKGGTTVHYDTGAGIASLDVTASIMDIARGINRIKD